MEFREFIKHCTKRESQLDQSTRIDETLLRRSLNIFSQATELLDTLKKRIFYGRTEMKDGTPINDSIWCNARAISNICEEIGDEKGAYIPDASIETNLRFIHGVVGIATEAGELIQNLAETIKNKKPIDRVNLKEEIGDTLFYVAILCDVADLDFDDILERNVAKLTARYGESFSAEKAINRDLETEYQILSETEK